jgi:phage-related protein
MAANLFEELKDSLTTFKTFLHENVDTIKPIVATLKTVVPKITELIDKLIELMGKLKTEIDKINPGVVGEGLAKVTEFTTATKNLLDAAKALLPDQAGPISEVQDIANVVSSLPSFGAIKDQLKQLIDEIVTDLKKLES